MTFSLVLRLYSKITGQLFSSSPMLSIRPFVILYSVSKNRTPKNVSILLSMSVCNSFSKETALDFTSCTSPDIENNLISAMSLPLNAGKVYPSYQRYNFNVFDLHILLIIRRSSRSVKLYHQNTITLYHHFLLLAKGFVIHYLQSLVNLHKGHMYYQ